jgi:putative addiction module component (TIGR02574 family)
MRESVAKLALQGKQLPPAEHEHLVDELLSSLNEPAVAELDTAWSAEVARRLEAYDSGAVTAVPAEEVFARARAVAR